MTTEELAELFVKHDDEYLHFDRVMYRTTNRPDLNAFNLLELLVPGKVDIISAASHDKFYLSVGIEELAAVALEENIITLIRCGVRLEKESDSLFMFC